MTMLWLIVYSSSWPSVLSAGQASPASPDHELVVATRWLVVVGVLQALVFFGTLLAIKRQGDVTQTQLRPWVAVEGIAFRSDMPPNIPLFLLRLDGRVLVPFFELKTKNMGQTVAMRISIPPAKVVIVDVERIEAPVTPENVERANRINRANFAAQRAVLERAMKDYCRTCETAPGASGGWLLFPDQPRADGLVAFGDPDELVNRNTPHELFIIGAVIYESPLKPGKPCQTSFAYQLQERQYGSINQVFTAAPTQGIEFQRVWWGTSAT